MLFIGAYVAEEGLQGDEARVEEGRALQDERGPLDGCLVVLLLHECLFAEGALGPLHISDYEASAVLPEQVAAHAAQHNEDSDSDHGREQR